MDGARRWLMVAAVSLALVALCMGAVRLRWVVARVFPITHVGKVMRIETFSKGGLSRVVEGTGQLNQFAIVFEDGMSCEGWDTSFAAVKAGDVIEIRAYHDVKGWPVLDPEWWECEEGQLVNIKGP